jgi:glycosyltransferase involved in cell wall biosynthesis
MKNKTVSIIIPAYNEEKHLPACLDSVLRLDYPRQHIEIIVIDNGSEDRTRDIAAAYGAKVLRNDSMNVSGLRNFGVREAKGDILAFVDADCIVSKEWLKNASVYFDDMTVAAWGAPPVIPEDATWVQQAWFLIRQKENQVQETDWLETMNLFVRKDQFLAAGGFNENLVTCEDVDFSYRIRKYGKIISDSRLNVIHLGEAATVRHFIKKEIWRGHSNFQGIFSHGLTLKEIPSLFIPLYFGIFLPVIFLSAVLFSDAWLAAGLLFYLIPSAAVLLKIRRKKAAGIPMLNLLFLLQIYFFSRTVAVAGR